LHPIDLNKSSIPFAFLAEVYLKIAPISYKDCKYVFNKANDTFANALP